MSSLLQLPATVIPGYLVILEGGNPGNTADRNDTGNWSDVVVFTPQSAQLFSDACNCFPTLSQVMSQPHMFILESSSAQMPGFTKYAPGHNTYFIDNAAQSDPLPADVTDTPEPASLLLAGAGLTGLALLRRLSKNL